MQAHRELPQFDSDVWAYNGLSITDRGYVEGSAYTHTFKDGCDVSIGVFSYEYDRDGEHKINHVPNVVVTDRDGRIIAEPHANDSSEPRTAIENARDAAEYVVEHSDEYV